MAFWARRQGSWHDLDISNLKSQISNQDWRGLPPGWMDGLSDNPTSSHARRRLLEPSKPPFDSELRAGPANSFIRIQLNFGFRITGFFMERNGPCRFGR